MCGRFTLTVDPTQLMDAFPWVNFPEIYAARYNIAPSQPVAVIPNDDKHELDFFAWGLIPFWVKDPNIGRRMINARAETIAEKPSFRNAFRRRRCLILSDGFYEWQREPGTKIKIPTYIRMKSKEPFGFAGLWENWQSADGSEIKSCTIITTQPNSLLKPIHNRMPVILPKDAYEIWLTSGEQQPKILQPLLKPYPASELEAYPVSRFVNNSRNDSPDCIEPLL